MNAQKEFLPRSNIERKGFDKRSGLSKPFRPFLCNDVWIFRLQIFCFMRILPYGREALREAGMDSRIREKAWFCFFKRLLLSTRKPYRMPSSS